MNQQNGSLNGTARESLFFHHHLTDEALLRSLDGELTSQQTTKVNRHLSACWSCRSRRQAIEQEITDLVSYQRSFVSPYLPPPAGGRSIFLARLDALINELEVQSPRSRWPASFQSLVGLLEEYRIPAIVFALAVLTMFAVIPSLRSRSTVSAKELIELSTNAEKRSLATQVHPVVVQKVRVSVGSVSLTRTLYHDVTRHRIKGRVESKNAAETEVKAAYSASNINWNSMLDTESYGHWRATLAIGEDRVVKIGNDRMRLETTSPSGPIRHADLTVRTSDYHAIEENFVLEDRSQIQIAELSYAVVPFASLPADIFEVPAAPVPLPPPAPLLRVPRTPLASSAELVNAGVDVEAALHAVVADLGEQIRIDVLNDHQIHITGVVKDSQRKQQLVAALDEIPHTRLDLLTVEEAAQQASLVPAPPAQPASPSSAQVMVAGPPLLETKLASRFPDKDQRIAFVNQTLSLAQLASARAWALNRLADRYPTRAVAELSEDSRGKLQMLLNDHVTALREDLSALQNQLGEILSRSSNTPSANTSIPEAMELGSGTIADSAADWRKRVRRVHSSTEAVHEAVSTLLSSSQPSDAESIEVNLRTSLTQLQTELISLDQKIRKSTLQ
jgi:hypothetical protein